MTADRLDLLAERRIRRTRQAPPPRHPRAEQPPRPVSTPGTRARVPADTRADVEAAVQPGTGGIAATVETAAPTAGAVPPAPAETVLRPAQFYVDSEADDYLRSIRAEALHRRVDISGSAVVRYALADLMARMTPTEVADALAAVPTDASTTGRKRR